MWFPLVFVLFLLYVFVILFCSAPLSSTVSGAIQMPYCDCDLYQANINTSIDCVLWSHPVPVLSQTQRDNNTFC